MKAVPQLAASVPTVTRPTPTARPVRGEKSRSSAETVTTA
jgi:hypothetical protein